MVFRAAPPDWGFLFFLHCMTSNSFSSVVGFRRVSSSTFVVSNLFSWFLPLSPTFDHSWDRGSSWIDSSTLCWNPPLFFRRCGPCPRIPSLRGGGFSFFLRHVLRSWVSSISTYCYHFCLWKSSSSWRTQMLKSFTRYRCFKSVNYLWNYYMF